MDIERFIQHIVNGISIARGIKCGAICGTSGTSGIKNIRKFYLIFPLLVMLPIQTTLATSTIAMDVELFCGANPISPPVTLCSTCHATVNNRSLNDLTTEGMWALSRAFSNFCQAATTPTPTPTPTPAPGAGMGGPGPGMGAPPGGMSGTGSGGMTGVGMGVGGSMDDDDDDHDDDDDDSMMAPLTGPLGTLLKMLTGD